MTDRPARYDVPPPVSERRKPPPPLVFGEDLDDQDRTWLVEYLMDQARTAAIASKRAKRAGVSTQAGKDWELSQRLYRLASVLNPQWKIFH